MNKKILLTKTPSFDQFKQDLLAANLASEEPAQDVDGGTKVVPTGDHTVQDPVWVDSNGNPILPERDQDGNITNGAVQADHVYVLSLFTDRAVQMSEYVTFDSSAEETYVGDLQTGLTVGSSEVIWDSSQSADAPANLTAGWAGVAVPVANI